MYQTHVRGIENEIGSVHDRLDILQALEDDIEENIRSVRTAKEVRSDELTVMNAWCTCFELLTH